MNIKLTPLLSAVALALIASTSSSLAKVYTAKTYKADLIKKLTKKSGKAAISSAALFLKTALTDPKNKALATNFTSTTVKTLKKPVAASLKVQQASALAKSVTFGIFKKGSYNPNDAIFKNALTAAVKSISVKTQKTTGNANGISKTVIAVKGGQNTPDNRGTIYGIVYKALGLPNPPVS